MTKSAMHQVVFTSTIGSVFRETDETYPGELKTTMTILFDISRDSTHRNEIDLLFDSPEIFSAGFDQAVPERRSYKPRVDIQRVTSHAL